VRRQRADVSMTPEQRADRIYDEAAADDAQGMISGALQLLAARTVQEILDEDHIGMTTMITGRLRAALRTSLADAVTYLWDHRSFRAPSGPPDAELRIPGQLIRAAASSRLCAPSFARRRTGPASGGRRR